MIKTFESFNKGDNNFDDVLKGLKSLYNDSYPGVGSELDNIDDDLYYQIMDDEQLFRELKDIDVNNIKPSDKIILTDVYNEFYDKYQLGEFPDKENIDVILLPIYDLTEVDFVISLESKIIKFDIDVIPDVKTFPNLDKIPLNIDKWDSIVSEIYPAVKRIEDLGYNVKTYLGTHGKIIIEVSL